MSTRTGNGDIYVLDARVRARFIASPSTMRPTSSTPGRATGMAVLLERAQRRQRDERRLSRACRRRNADGRERRQIHAGILERAVAERREHDRVHRPRAHDHGLVAQRAQPHRRKSDLARALRRCDADVRGGDEGRIEERVADVERRRQDAVLRLRPQRRENIWAQPAGGTARAATTFTRTAACVWPTISYDGKTIVFERNFGDLDARRRERRARARCRSRCAAPARRPASSTRRSTRLPVARAVAGREEGRVHGARRCLCGVGARGRRRRRESPTRRELEEELTWAPDSRRIAYVSDRDGADAPVPVRFRHAHRDAPHARRAQRRRSRPGRPTAVRSRSCAARRNSSSST